MRPTSAGSLSVRRLEPTAILELSRHPRFSDHSKERGSSAVALSRTAHSAARCGGYPYEYPVLLGLGSVAIRQSLAGKHKYLPMRMEWSASYLEAMACKMARWASRGNYFFCERPRSPTFYLWHGGCGKGGIEMKPQQPSQPTCQRVGVRWIALFAHFSIPVLLGLGLGLAGLAIIMNSYSLMLAHERIDDFREELRAMQNKLESIE